VTRKIPREPAKLPIENQGTPKEPMGGRTLFQAQTTANTTAIPQKRMLEAVRTAILRFLAIAKKTQLNIKEDLTITIHQDQRTAETRPASLQEIRDFRAPQGRKRHDTRIHRVISDVAKAGPQDPLAAALRTTNHKAQTEAEKGTIGPQDQSVMLQYQRTITILQHQNLLTTRTTGPQ